MDASDAEDCTADGGQRRYVTGDQSHVVEKEEIASKIALKGC